MLLKLSARSAISGAVIKGDALRVCPVLMSRLAVHAWNKQMTDSTRNLINTLCKSSHTHWSGFFWTP
ncbi:hypothetical protein CHARACLAT_014333 [Characodon lateralis]|uniref:Uncharacterized protein n=1 Tax=Characodon lateralis TaxID=208331 RepID=A0ABU7EW45_9TELE|nr:hypothetical protein [Characodon lateralis]